MSLSVYVHIPYCLQRCRYCDFTTFEWKEILPPERYVNFVLNEIRHRHRLWPERRLATLYFGGGTPSLLAPELIVAIKQELANVGFAFTPDAEVTIEINPATLTPEKLDQYLAAGINRFSVGAQTFNDQLLSVCGRKHSAEDTRKTLELLRGHNYSFDLLFALPGQTKDDLARDLDEVAAFAPPHLSAYCLTVPDGHPMSTGRAPEDEQVEMFAQIEEQLATIGLAKYEISNFARPGFESRHNGVYWNGRPYWGLGLSSHSYEPRAGGHGLRFWNPKSLKIYEAQSGAEGARWQDVLPTDQYEELAAHEALTDLCHMFLRTMAGLPEAALQQRPPRVYQLVLARLERLARAGWVELLQGHWRLTHEGTLISNQVFGELTFLREDLTDPALTRQNTATYCAL